MDTVRFLVDLLDPRRIRRGTFKHLATAVSNGEVVAVAGFEKRVQVWSIETPSLLSDFETVLEFGGRRLALCTPPSRSVVVAGAWERHGVCGYGATTGERLWQRKDLKRVGPITPAGDGRLVAACFQDRSMQVLDAQTGTTVATVRGVRGFWQSRHAPIGLGATLGHVALIGTEDWSIRWRAPVTEFAVLAAAFGPDGVLVSDTGPDEGTPASVYCFDLRGRARWRYSVAREGLVSCLGWDEASGDWLGVEHNVNNSTPDRLLRWSADGEPVSGLRLGLASDYAFLPSGRMLLTGRGRLLDTRTGNAIARLTAPA